jgi:hypothetical protein
MIKESILTEVGDSNNLYLSPKDMLGEPLDKK